MVDLVDVELHHSQCCLFRLIIVSRLFVLFRLVENEMTDDAAPHLADMIQANTGLTHLW